MIGQRGGVMGVRTTIPIVIQQGGRLKVEVKGVNVVWVLPNGTNIASPILDTPVQAGTVSCLVDNLFEYGYFKLYTETTAIASINVANFEDKIRDTFHAYITPVTNLTLSGALSNLSNVKNILYTSNALGLSGNLSDLSPTLTSLRLQGGANIQGNLSSISNMPLTSLNLTGCNKIEGNLASIPSTIAVDLSLSSVDNVTGDLSTLQCRNNDLNSLYLYSCGQITGSLSTLGNIRTSLIVWNCYSINGVYTPSENSTIKTVDLFRTGQTPTDVDGTLIAFATNLSNNNITGRTISVKLHTKGQAVNTAINTLKNIGWTVKINDLVV